MRGVSQFFRDTKRIIVVQSARLELRPKGRIPLRDVQTGGFEMAEALFAVDWLDRERVRLTRVGIDQISYCSYH